MGTSDGARWPLPSGGDTVRLDIACGGRRAPACLVRYAAAWPGYLSLGICIIEDFLKKSLSVHINKNVLMLV